MNTNWRHALALIAALAVAQAASAQGRGKGKSGDGKPGTHGDAKRGKDASPVVIVVDRDGHRRVFHDYYSGRSLPPRERGQLPPGLQKHLIEVPAPLQARMQPLPPNYQRYFAGRDLIVVDVAKQSNIWCPERF